MVRPLKNRIVAFDPDVSYFKPKCDYRRWNGDRERLIFSVRTVFAWLPVITSATIKGNSC